MKLTRRAGISLFAATTMLTAGCGDDEPTATGLQFPAFPQTLIQALCFRGNGTVGETKTGTLDTADCDAAEVIDATLTTYFETWRVRVATAGDVTFDASSGFDNVLVVARVNQITQTSIDADVIGQNDDRAPGTDTNALVTVRLEPNTDYLVGILGTDYSQVGSYTLRIQ